MKKKSTEYIFRLCYSKTENEPVIYQIFEVVASNANWIEVRQIILYSFTTKSKYTKPLPFTRNIHTEARYEIGNFRYEQYVYDSIEHLMEFHILDII